MTVQSVAQATLSATDARALTDRIRQTLSLGHDLIVTAWQGRAWVALGYDSWDAYCSSEFADARMVRLDREQRREIVADMRQAGMSTRAIGSGLGASHMQVQRDLRPSGTNVPVEPPPAVTSLDGRQRPASRPPLNVNPQTGEIVTAPTSPTSAQRRPALTDQARTAGWDLRKAVERIERIAADDRFDTHHEQMTSHLRGHLTHAVQVCQDLLDRINPLEDTQ